MVGAASAAAAQDAVPSLVDVLKRVESLESENAALRHEVDALRTEVGDGWLSEQRAEQIRGIVHEVLADADTRASLLQGGPTAGWDPGSGFYIADPLQRFLLQISGQLQVRWVYNYHDQPDRHRYGFENTRTRLSFGGYVFNPDMTYYIRGAFDRDGGGAQSPEISGGNLQLYDAWIRWQLDSTWSLRFGQFKLPFNREELVESSRQLAVERSLVNESVNIGRSQGVELGWHSGAHRLAAAFSDGGHDQLGGFNNFVGTNTANTPALDEDVEWILTTRYELLLAGAWDQFKDFTSPQDDEFGALFGIAGHAQENEFGTGSGSARDQQIWFAYTADLSLELGGTNAFVSFAHHYVDSPAFGFFNIFGIVGQAGWYLTPKTELFARFEWGRFEFESLDFSDLYLVTMGFNYYVDGHDAKLTTDIGFGISKVENTWDSDIAGWRFDGDGVEPQIVFRTQFQLLF
jgi:hypothetical protein